MDSSTTHDDDMFKLNAENYTLDVDDGGPIIVQRIA